MIRFLKLTILKYWGIDQSVSYGTSQTILNTTAGIVDTGTTLLLLATGMHTYFRVIYDTHLRTQRPTRPTRRQLVPPKTSELNSMNEWSHSLIYAYQDYGSLDNHAGTI